MMKTQKFFAAVFTVTTLILGVSVTGAAVIERAAGGVSDGGGSAIVCRDVSKQITSAELLDLWEARLIYGRNVTVNIDPTKDHFDLALQVADNLDKGGAGQDLTGVTTSTNSSGRVTDRSISLRGGDVFGHSVQYGIENVRKIMRLLPTGTSLKLIEDYTSPIIPRDCAVEQLALFQDSANRLLVVDEIWSKLDRANKSALIVHEALYRSLRGQGDVNSDRTRLMVGLAFSAYAFEWTYGGLPDDFLLCHSTEEKPLTRLAAYIENGAAVFQFFQIDGSVPLSRTRIALALQHSPFADPATVQSSITFLSFGSPLYETSTLTFRLDANEDKSALEMEIATEPGTSGSSINPLPMKCHQTKRPFWNHR